MTAHIPAPGSNRVIFPGVAILILIVAVTAAIAVAHLRTLAETRIDQTGRSLSSTLELTLDGLIDPINASMLAAANMIAWQARNGHIDAALTSDFLVRQQRILPHLKYLRATNARGDVVYGPGLKNPPTNLSDRDYFQTLRDHPHSEFVVSKPLQGRGDATWAWVFARRITLPDGRFGGMVYGRIDVAELEALLADIKLSPGDSIAVRDADMGLIARFPPINHALIGIGDKHLSRQFREALRRDPNAGSYAAPATALDTIDRRYAYRRSAKYGETVNVGLSVDNALAEWRHQAWLVFAFVIAFALASQSFAFVIYQAWRRREADLHALRSSQRQLLDSQSALERMAHHDILTGLPNRQLLADRFGQALARAQRQDRCIALLFIDLNGFKPINDGYGHVGGDEALCEVARRLRHVVRRSDTVARVGGDEFVVLLDDLGDDARRAAQAVADKCLALFEDDFMIRHHPCRLSASIGIALGDGNSQLDDLMTSADGAMYRAKQQCLREAVWAD